MATIITDWAQWLSGQTAASGALAILYCATAPELEGMWRMGGAAPPGGLGCNGVRMPVTLLALVSALLHVLRLAPTSTCRACPAGVEPGCDVRPPALLVFDTMTKCGLPLFPAHVG
jgi:hypothetical protein